MSHDDIPTPGTVPETRPVRDETTIHPPDLNVEVRVQSLAQKIRDRAAEGCSVGLMTITPIEVSRDRRRIPDVVHDPVLKVIFHLGILMNRGPHPANRNRRNILPFLAGAADLPIAAEHPGEVDPDPVGGLRYRGLLAIPPGPLGARPTLKPIKTYDEFLRGGTGVERIDVEEIDPTMISDAMRKCLATVCRGALGFDEAVLVLHRARREPTL